MKVNPIKALAICFLSSITTVGIMYGIHHQVKPTKNDFMRSFVRSGVLQQHALERAVAGYQIIGTFPNKIILSNPQKPDTLVSLSDTLTDRQYHLLTTTDQTTIIPGTQISMDSTRLYAFTPYSKKLYTGTFPEGVLSPLKHELSGSATQICALDSPFFILRTYTGFNASTAQAELQRYSITVPTISSPITFTLQKQKEVQFSTKGHLLYNRYLQRLIYVYLYRNQFDVMDTTLQRVLEGNTLDTIKQVNLTPHKNLTTDITVLANKLPVVNRAVCTTDSLLYIHSGMMADNETLKAFKKNNVVDIYNLANGSYQFSFYIPNYKEQSLHSFKVYQDKLIVLYRYAIVIYTMPERQTPV